MPLEWAELLRFVMLRVKGSHGILRAAAQKSAEPPFPGIWTQLGPLLHAPEGRELPRAAEELAAYRSHPLYVALGAEVAMALAAQRQYESAERLVEKVFVVGSVMSQAVTSVPLCARRTVRQDGGGSPPV